MQRRSPRTILATATAAALVAAALAPLSAFAKGPGPGAAGCDGDCSNDQAQAQQLQTRARGGPGGQATAQTRQGTALGWGRSQHDPSDTATGPGAGQQRRVGPRGLTSTQAQGCGSALRLGLAGDTGRGLQTCDECQLEMGVLNDGQRATLLYMANEEKLAHDVYLALAEQYDLVQFERIAASEARHQSAVAQIMERYRIEGSPIDLPPGEFGGMDPESDTDTDFGALYRSLVERGSEGLSEAIEVGIFIEEDDIAALAVAMEGLEVGAPDVHYVYSNLSAASQRHLVAFQNAALENVSA